MNNHQIDKILTRNQITSPHYLGCFASDEILNINPMNLPFPQSMVVNFDPSDSKGSHWVAIFVNSPNNVDYYDSLGIWPPLNNNITKFLSQFKLIRFNPYAFQNQNAKNCGKHTIFFLYNRSNRKSLDQILNFLSKLKPSAIDGFVEIFVKNKIFTQ